MTELQIQTTVHWNLWVRPAIQMAAVARSCVSTPPNLKAFPSAARSCVRPRRRLSLAARAVAADSARAAKELTFLQLVAAHGAEAFEEGFLANLAAFTPVGTAFRRLPVTAGSIPQSIDAELDPDGMADALRIRNGVAETCPSRSSGAERPALLCVFLAQFFVRSAAGLLVHSDDGHCLQTTCLTPRIKYSYSAADGGTRSAEAEIPPHVAFTGNYILVPDNLDNNKENPSGFVVLPSHPSRWRGPRRLWVDAPAFHLWNAWEEPETKELVVIGSSMTAASNSTTPAGAGHDSALTEIRINTVTGESTRRAILVLATSASASDRVLGTVNSSLLGQKTQYAYLAVPSGFAKLDLATGDILTRVGYGEGWIGGEPCFVPVSSPRGEDDGYVLWLVHAGTSELLLVSAADMRLQAAIRLPSSHGSSCSFTASGVVRGIKSAWHRAFVVHEAFTAFFSRLARDITEHGPLPTLLKLAWRGTMSNLGYLVARPALVCLAAYDAEGRKLSLLLAVMLSNDGGQDAVFRLAVPKKPVCTLLPLFFAMSELRVDITRVTDARAVLLLMLATGLKVAAVACVAVAFRMFG